MLAYAYVCPKCSSPHCSVAATESESEPVQVVCRDGCGYQADRSEFRALSQRQFFNEFGSTAKSE